MNLNWTIAKIEEIAEINPRLGKADIPNDLLVSFVPMPAVGAGNGLINVSNVRPYAEVKKGFTSFQEGDVLFAKITPCMENGKMAIVPKVENGYAFGSTEFHVLRPKPGIDARYLYYYVSSRRFRGEAEHQMSGAVGQKRVPTQYLRECTIPVSPPNEQTRIVAEIEKQFSRLDEAVANLKRVKANLKRYKAAVLKAAVEGKLTEEWRKNVGAGSPRPGRGNRAPTETGAELLARILSERRANWQGKGKYKEAVAPDTSGLPELPAGWVWLTVGSVSFVTKLAGFEYTKFVKYEPGGDLCVIKAENAGKEGFKRTDFSRVKSETVAQLTRSKLIGGDLLMVFVGSVGNVARVPDDREYFLGPNIAMIRIDSTSVSSAYLELFLRSPVGNSLALGFSKAVTQPSLSMGTIRMIPVAIPSLAEQHQIVAEVERRLSIVAGAVAQVDANLRRADRLRQSVLKQAFSGQLVPQDPNDEPASMLLERIQIDEGAIHESPAVPPRKPKRAIRESPLREPRQTAALQPLPMVAEAPATYGDAINARILAAMQPGREYARADLAEPLGLSTGQWNAAIQELKRVGKVRQTGERRGARYFLL